MGDDVTPTLPPPVPPHRTIPPDITTLADYERHARRHLTDAAWAHIQGGAGAETSRAADRAAFDRLRLVSRVLADLRGATTAIDLLGQRHAAPILLAPIAYQRLAHPDGELATVRAAQALGVGMIVSTLASVTLEAIAAARQAAAQELGRDPAPLWFQLYLQDDRRDSAALLHRAEAAGYDAIVVTVDASIKPAGFVLPDGVVAANLDPSSRRLQRSTVTDAILFGTPLADAAPRWDDIAWLRSATRLPLVVKGILAPGDAEAAIACGADAVVVSNHGGRVLDGLVPSIDALPGIAAVVGGRVPLLLDGGVRTGVDVVRAIARGASAVLIGRPQLHALAVAGMAGVAHALHLLRAELELAMAQLGCRDPGDIDRSQLFADR